jgi:DNA-binding GntR family transcriptional regulator
MKIDPESADYPYVQLAAHLRRRISSGEITSLLPSLTALTQETGLSMGTVRRAVALLIDEGLVVTVPGRGMFVRERGTPRQS